jgi:hypothetical protein
MFMGFFNALSTRIPLAVIGGILYGFLTYYIVILLDLSFQIAISAAVFIFLLYVGSRFLILFSGINTPYYSKSAKGIPKPPIEKNPFYFTSQWVGKFYNYHDIVLFVFLIGVAIAFLTSLMIDWSGNKPFGHTTQNILNAFFTLP